MQSVALPTADDLRFFHENGYWIAPKLFDDALLAQARAHMERIHQGEYDKNEPPLSAYQPPDADPAKALHQTNNAWWCDSVMEQVALSPKIGQIASLLLEVESIYMWHDQMLYKPGDSDAAGNVGWHQDKEYWSSASTHDMITAWVAFDDTDEENGCMRFIAGSNHWGLVHVGNFYDPDIEGQRSRACLPQGREWHEAPAVMKAGQVSIHHCMTLHGSGPNRSHRPRRSLAVHLMSGETRLVKGHGHSNEGIFGGEDGELFRGPRYPCLWPQTTVSS